MSLACNATLLAGPKQAAILLVYPSNPLLAQSPGARRARRIRAGEGIVVRVGVAIVVLGVVRIRDVRRRRSLGVHHAPPLAVRTIIESGTLVLPRGQRRIDQVRVIVAGPSHCLSNRGVRAIRLRLLLNAPSGASLRRDLFRNRGKGGMNPLFALFTRTPLS